MQNCKNCNDVPMSGHQLGHISQGTQVSLIAQWLRISAWYIGESDSDKVWNSSS